MSEPIPVEFSEESVPFAGIEETVEELVDLFGGEVTARRSGANDFTLPLRRGGAGGGSVECSLAWTPVDEVNASVKLVCNRNVDAPRLQRVFLLVAGVAGALMFMLWPFYPHEKEYGTLAWLGGAVAIAVYLMTLRRSSGGIAYDFLKRLVDRQRTDVDAPK